MEETLTFPNDTIPAGVENIHISILNGQNSPVMNVQGHAGLIIEFNGLR